MTTSCNFEGTYAEKEANLYADMVKEKAGLIRQKAILTNIDFEK